MEEPFQPYSDSSHSFTWKRMMTKTFAKRVSLLFQKSIGFSSHQRQLACEVWKWLGKNCSVYHAQKVLYTETECQSWHWPLTPPSQKSKGFLLSSSTTCMWSLKVIGQNCSLNRAHKVLYTEHAECQSWPWPLTQNQQASSSHHLRCACEVWKWLAKNCCLNCAYKIFYSVKVDLDLWPINQKSIGFLPSSSSSTTCMWSLKVIGKKL